MGNYIILHHYKNDDLIYLNPKFVESIKKSEDTEVTNGTDIYCVGNNHYYLVKESVEEVRKKVWGTI